MREFLILALIIVVIIFLAPMVMSLILFFLCIAAIAVLLAYFGFLPGFRYVRYMDAARANKSSRQWKWKFRRGGRNSRGGDASQRETNRDSGGGWYRTSQEGEEITLPETALRKENEKK